MAGSMSEACPRAVVKIGGSLFDLPRLPERIVALLQQLAPRRVALICGGGVVLNKVRDWAAVYGIDEPAAHETALCGLDLTARMLHHVLPGTMLADSRSAIEQAWDAGSVPIVLPSAIWSRTASVQTARSWSLTSDTLAVSLTQLLQADELVLVKSRSRPEGQAAEAAAIGAVDLCFPFLVEEVPRVRWVDLRRQPLEIDDWLENPDA